MLKGEVALITGASRGIGQAILYRLGGLGAAVIGTATTAEGAAGISADVLAAGCRGEGARLEVRDAVQVHELIAHIQRTYGPVSILVNNAGITRDNLSMRMKDEEWDDVLDTDLKAVFHLSKAVLRGMMKAKKGRIINVTSVVAHSGNGGQANYCAAKAGVAGMSRALARELGSRNITVNCVAPGLIDTDMTRTLDEGQKASLLSTIPLGRLGFPQDVAAAVAFLASTEAGYVTGTTLHVNGGMFMD